MTNEFKQTFIHLEAKKMREKLNIEMNTLQSLDIVKSIIDSYEATQSFESMRKSLFKSAVKQKFIDFVMNLEHIEDLTINPSFVSNDFEKHDCDQCPMSLGNQGDTFDSYVCKQCWADAIADS